MPPVSTAPEPDLPNAAGPLSGAVIEVLSGRPPRHLLNRIDAPLGDADPYGLDLQLALGVCYELHHRGFRGVDPRWEWNPGLLHLRGALEERFEDALLRDVGELESSATARADLAALTVAPGDGAGLSTFLRDEGTWDQVREYFVHRSIQHLRQADSPNDAPQRSYAELLSAASLKPGYLAYVNHVTAESFTVVNLASLLGLHRVRRGAAAGRVAATEATSTVEADHLVLALQRLQAPLRCVRFFDEAAGRGTGHDLVGQLLAREPRLDRDVVFGIRAQRLVEERLAAHLTKSWVSGHSSLRRPIF